MHKLLIMNALKELAPGIIIVWEKYKVFKIPTIRNYFIEPIKCSIRNRDQIQIKLS